MQRNRVSNWTPTEEYHMVFERLPWVWAHKVKLEENRRDRSKFWARVTNAPDVSAATLKAALLAEEISIKEVHATDGGFLVLAQDEGAQSKLVGLSGCILEGKALKINRTQVKMTAEEIFAFIEDHLKVDEEAKELNLMGTATPG